LLHLPQGQHSRRPEPLQGFPPRPEPLRHLPAQRRVRARRPQLLLSAQGRAKLRRLPHAVAGIAGFRGELFQSHEHLDALHPQSPVSGGQHRLAYIRGDTNDVKIEEAFLKGSLRVDIFGIKDGGAIDDTLTAPLRPKVPALKRGHRYLLEVVLRTLKVGHPFTQGTVDSNEVWVDSKVKSGDQSSAATADWAAQRGGSVVAFHQRLYARPQRQPRGPPQSAGHFHPALQPPDPAGRGPGGALRLYGARRPKRAADRRGEAAIPQVRHALHELRFRHQLRPRRAVHRDQQPAHRHHRGGQNHFPGRGSGRGFGAMAAIAAQTPTSPGGSAGTITASASCWRAASGPKKAS
jgi:hypothetical protein